MNVLKLAWRNIAFRPLQSSLSVLLLALGVGLVVILLLLQKQLNQNFDRNLAGVDLILGAKGSPLQMVMSSMYQLDAPTGNLTIEEVKPFINPRHPLIEEVVPLSMGDNFRGFRIIGATPNLIDWYGGELNTGKLYTHDGQAVIGSEVAEVSKMTLGDVFTGDHGLMEDDPLHETHAHEFEVTGILKPSGTVLDRIVLVTNQAYWTMHEGHDHDHGDEHDHHEHSPDASSTRGSTNDNHHAHEDGHDHNHGDAHDHADHDHSDHDHSDHDHASHDEGNDHAEHDHSGHDHAEHDHSDHDHSSHDHAEHEHSGHSHAQDGNGRPLTAADLLEEDASKELTSVLVRYKNEKDYQSLQMGRAINENTDIMAVDPAYQISKVRYQFGQGERVLRILAIVIIIVSALSVFISLFNSLRERRFELALMRGMGAGRPTIFGLIVSEGLLLGLVGFIVGIALGHGVMEILSTRLEDNYGFRFNGFQWLQEAWWLLLGALGVGVIAAILPAAQAAETDIAETLT